MPGWRKETAEANGGTIYICRNFQTQILFGMTTKKSKGKATDRLPRNCKFALAEEVEGDSAEDYGRADEGVAGLVDEAEYQER